MPVNFGPELLPYPQPSDAPDGPGAFLALIQKMVVGGIIPYTTYALMAAPAGFLGEHRTVTSDPDAALNGDYVLTGTGWKNTTEDTGWTNLTLASGATTSGGLTPAVRRINGITWIRGRVLSSGTGALFTIPSGYAIGQEARFGTMTGSSGSATNVLVVGTDGVVYTAANTIVNTVLSWPVG